MEKKKKKKSQLRRNYTKVLTSSRLSDKATGEEIKRLN